MYYVIEIFRFLLNVFNFKKKIAVPGPIYKIFVQKYNYKKINLNSETTIPPRKIEKYGEPNEIIIKIFSFLSTKELEIGYACCMEFALASFTLMSRRDINFRLTTNYCYFCRKEGKNGYVLNDYILNQCGGGCLRFGCECCLKNHGEWELTEKRSLWTCDGCLCICDDCKMLYHPRNIERCWSCEKRFCYECDEEFVIRKNNWCSKCWSEILEDRRIRRIRLGL